MKARLALLMAAVLMMYSVVLTGCQSKLILADQAVEVMYDLAIEGDAIPVKDLLGFASEDDVRSSLLTEDYTEMTDMLENQFGGFGIDLTDEEVQETSDTMTGLLNKLNHTAEIQGETKNETTVLLRMVGYSNDGLAQVMGDLIAEMWTNMDEETMAAVVSGDEEAAQKLMQDMIKQFVARVGEVEPSAKTTNMTVKCEKMKVEVSGREKVSWMPVGMDKFTSGLGGTVFK